MEEPAPELDAKEELLKEIRDLLKKRTSLKFLKNLFAFPIRKQADSFTFPFYLFLLNASLPLSPTIPR